MKVVELVLVVDEFEVVVVVVVVVDIVVAEIYIEDLYHWSFIEIDKTKLVLNH